MRVFSWFYYDGAINPFSNIFKTKHSTYGIAFSRLIFKSPVDSLI